MLDADGDVVRHHVYDAFGNLETDTAPLVEHRFGFTGQEHDLKTGLYFYNARYFDAES